MFSDKINRIYRIEMPTLKLEKMESREIFFCSQKVMSHDVTC